MNAIAASERVMSPPARPFIAMKPTFAASQRFTSATSRSEAR